MLEIAQQDHHQPLPLRLGGLQLQFVPYGEQIQQSLGGMLSRAVSGVDDWSYAGRLQHCADASLDGMAQDNGIRFDICAAAAAAVAAAVAEIAAGTSASGNLPHGLGQVLSAISALVETGVVHVPSPQPRHGGLEAARRPGAGLVEDRGQRLAREPVVAPAPCADGRPHILCGPKQQLEARRRHLRHRHEARRRRPRLGIVREGIDQRGGEGAPGGAGGCRFRHGGRRRMPKVATKCSVRLSNSNTFDFV